MITYEVRPVEFGAEIVGWVSKNHYSQTCPRACKYCFGLFDSSKMIGVLLVSNFSRNQSSQKYAGFLELSRLFVLDNTPKNTESFFISRAIKWLKKNTDIKGLISYSDPTVGHTGTIYLAANFSLIGKTSKSYHYLDSQGLRVHKKMVWQRAKNRGVAESVQAKEEGLTKSWESPKNIFCYQFNRKAKIDFKQRMTFEFFLEQNKVGFFAYPYLRMGNWYSILRIRGKRKHCGYFVDKDTALDAAKRKAKEEYETSINKSR